MTGTRYRMERRALLVGGTASTALSLVPGARVRAQSSLDRVSFQTNWRAQAEHGGPRRERERGDAHRHQPLVEPRGEPDGELRARDQHDGAHQRGAHPRGRAVRLQLRGGEVRELIEEGQQYGMQTFDQHLAELVRREVVAYEVALAAATRPARSTYSWPPPSSRSVSTSPTPA